MKKLFLFLVAVITLSVCASAQTRTVKGTVVDAANDEPLIGVSVQAGTGYGAATDVDGNFVLKVPAATKTLQVSYVGYKTQTVQITSDNLKIRLHSDTEVLNEVFAVAYGTSTRASFTGSAAVVGAATLENAQVSNPLNALKGKVAGVQMSNVSGAPGADSPTIRIRGISSINAGNDPLVVLDGTPYAGELNSINTNDIESMTILKDAASTALYGSRGANGVILITTKKAKAGEARVTVDVKLGSNSRAQQDYNYIKNPAQYYETYYAALYNSRIAAGASPAAANVWANNNLISGSSGLGYNVYNVPAGQTLIGSDGKLNPNATLGNMVTNAAGQEFWLTPDSWLDAAYHNSLRQEYNVSVSKGSDNSNFYMSAGYLDNAGITPQSGFRRFTGRLAADTQAKSWLKVGADMSYTYYERDIYGSEEGSSGSTGNPFAFVSNIAPIYPLYVRGADKQIMKDNNGFDIYDYGDGKTLPFSRPILPQGNAIGSALLDKNERNGNAFSATGYATVRFLEDFSFTTNNSMDFNEYRNTQFTNPYYGSYASDGGIVYKTQNRRLAYTFQQLLNWSHKFGLHNVQVLVGHENFWNKFYNLSGSRKNMLDPKNMELTNLISVRDASSYTTDYDNEGWIFRGQYDFDGKYFASASFRRDASSRFHPDHRWGSFWSASAAWLLNKENFLTEQTWIDMLKLKVSYGEQGNDNIGDWLYTNTYVVENSSDNVAIVPYRMGNENITWEKNGNFNAGFEFDLFKMRLGGSVEYFYRKTSDMLFFFPLPPSYGWTGYYDNIGDMANQGVEIDLHGTVIETKDFTWDINLNLTWYKNKITRLPEERRTMWCDGVQGFSGSEFFYGEGESMFTYRIYKYAGVDKETGESLWYKNITKKDDKGNVVRDENNQPVVIGTETTNNTAEADYYLCGSALAPVYGGFGTSLNYKWFDLSVSFDYQLGGKMLDTTYAGLMGSPYQGSIGGNFHADILNAWTPENKNSDIPRLCFGDNLTSALSDRWLTSASYLSLSNIVFGFTLPENLTQKLYLSKVRFYFNADNVWLWSKRQGLDPRLSLSGGGNNTYYSPIRTLSGGVNITF